MKLSLAWIFDHIEADYTKIDVTDLVRQFNKITAEIEGFWPISIPADRLFWGAVKHVNASGIQLVLVQSGQEVTLPYRSDIAVADHVLVYQYQQETRWATLIDFGGQKEGLLPKLEYDQGALSLCEMHDYIIEIDNKSVTHRPDMWGHRGVAREIAAILDLSLKPLNQFLEQQDVVFKEEMRAQCENYTLSIDAFVGCSRFAAAACTVEKISVSSLWMAARLAKIDAKPINSIVDTTNYVMFDLGHPMHAFDADTFENTAITVRRAQEGETLQLLDDHDVALTPDDIIVAAGDVPVSLAGVMGGKKSSVTQHTKHMLIEAALFDGGVIRKTALRHKKRTESSARFEKELDANGVVPALQRFFKLIKKVSSFKQGSFIVCVGKRVHPLDVQVTHSYLEAKLGLALDVKEVISIFDRLECVVQAQKQADGDTLYVVSVPTFRTTKDISMKDDLLEEVGRFVGYDMIQPVVPKLPLRPKNYHKISAQRRLRDFLRFGLQMHELCEYAFFDEQFLTTLAWNPEDAAVVSNPVSENWKRLVTTLIPNLLKAVAENSSQYSILRFFESGRTWVCDQKTVAESQKIAGILFDAHAKEDFYTGKTAVERLCKELGHVISWHSVPVVDTTCATWFEPYHVGYVMHNNQRLGIAGVVSQTWIKKIAPKGCAFIFELDTELLLQQPDQKKFTPLAKYPIVERDISIMISSQTTAAVLKQLIVAIDPRIKRVELVDFFEKPEWENSKAMTYRVFLYDDYKTLTGQEVDQIMLNVSDCLIKQGAIIR